MSYLFCTLLYRNGRFEPRFVAEAMAKMTPTFAGEQMIEIAVTPEVTAIVHEPGRVRLKSEGFASGCEFFLVDTFLEDLHARAVRAGHPDPQLYAWVSSDMSLYDVALKFERDGFEGRLLIEDEGERVRVAKGALVAYEQRTIEVDPGVSDDEEGFDDAYEEAREREEAPFHPGTFLHAELGITRQQMIEALHDLGTRGRRVWPSKVENGAGSADEDDGEESDFVVPAPPLWAWMRDEFAKSERGRGATKAPAKSAPAKGAPPAKAASSAPVKKAAAKKTAPKKVAGKKPTRK